MTNTWTTKTGSLLDISQMSTQHIKNALAMLERKGYVKTETLVFYLTCPLPRGEAAQYCFDRELGAILDSPTTRYIQLFEDELAKRINDQQKP